MTALRWASCALLLLSVADARPVAPFREASTTSQNRGLRYSNDQEEEIPVSVTINSFDLQLEGSFPSDPDPDDVHETLQIFLYSYVGNVTAQKGYACEDLFLADDMVIISGRRRLTVSSLNMSVSGGVAFFTNEAYSTPTQGELESIIATGLEKQFPKFVNENVEGATIKTSTFISSTPAPTPAPVTPDSLEAPEQSVDDNSKKRGIIAAGATGAFLGILIVAAALLVRRHRGPSLDEYLERARGESSKDNATHIQSSINDDGHHDDDDEDGPVGKSSSGETTSTGQRDMATQDDSSQWTLSTYPEDANTVMTFGTSGKSVVTTSQGNIDRTESFERDRQVSLRKDMLNTSPEWNATDVSDEPAAKKVDDTVLEPSHFVTADEPPLPPTTDASKTTSTSAPQTARFAANDEGEEIYLMPPAKKASKVSFKEAE